MGNAQRSMTPSASDRAVRRRAAWPGFAEKVAADRWSGVASARGTARAGSSAVPPGSASSTSSTEGTAIREDGASDGSHVTSTRVRPPSAGDVPTQTSAARRVVTRSAKVPMARVSGVSGRLAASRAVSTSLPLGAQ